MPRLREADIVRFCRGVLSNRQRLGHVGRRPEVVILAHPLAGLLGIAAHITAGGDSTVPERADREAWNAFIEKYRLIETQQEGLTAADAVRASGSRTFDLTARREKRTFSLMTLVAEVSRYLNLNPLVVEELLDAMKDGAGELVAMVNEFNELLYDEIIPHLFRQLYDLDESQQTEEHEVDLIKLPPKGY